MNVTIGQQLTNWARGAFKSTFPDCKHDFEDVRAVPTANAEFGDYQCNAAMGLAKILKKAPRAIADAVDSSAELPALVARLEVAGPGFINIFLDDNWLAQEVVNLESTERCGVPDVGAGKTVVMDYGSPNISKPLHIGHLRSHNIGSALDQLYRFLGYQVIADNHLGDWGTQFGISFMGYRHFGDEKRMQEHPLEELERVYVLSNQRAKDDEEWLDQCRHELVKLQSGDPENLELWKTFVRLSLEELERIYQRLGVSFDIIRGESYYNEKLPAVLELLAERGLSRESEGATVVDLEEEKLPLCIVRKKDGGFNYATTDLATVFSRVDEFSPERIVYVTDERQQLHFKQFFAICRRLGVEVRLDHVWFGLMRLPEGTFSTREGNAIKLEVLLDRAEEEALKIVQASSPDLDAGQSREIARAVGIGAVKYADLSQNPQSLVTFTFEKALALEGNSGPYLQYAGARMASVRRKYDEAYPGKDPAEYALQMTEPIEHILAVKLLRFGDTVCSAADTYRPNMVADYLYDLAQTYSTFYQNVPFLKAPDGIRESRVRLCGLVSTVLRRGLSLLGIEALERI